MRSENIKAFLLILVIIVLFILLKNGQIFDIGTILEFGPLNNQPIVYLRRLMICKNLIKIY